MDVVMLIGAPGIVQEWLVELLVWVEGVGRV